MLKACLEIITEKERGMKLFSRIHMFVILFQVMFKLQHYSRNGLKFNIDFVSTSLFLMPGITRLHYIVSDMDKNRLFHL